MSTKYVISFFSYGNYNYFEITKDQFDSIKTAKDNLFECLFLEEKFDILIEDYLEFETELLTTSTRFMIQRNLTYDKLHGERRLVGRRLVNLLTACRLYLDHAPHHLSNIFGQNSSFIKKFESLTNTEYSNVLGYRCMEALRNYIQHRDVPISNLQFCAHSDEDKTERTISYFVLPIMRISDLEKDPKFKRQVLTELKVIAEEFDLRLFIRQYMASISHIQDGVREMLKSHVAEWDKIIKDIMSRCRGELNVTEDSVINMLVKKSNKEIERISIFTEFIESREDLARRNSGTFAVLKGYVTAKIMSET